MSVFYKSHQFEVLGSSFNIAFLIKASSLDEARKKGFARMRYPYDHFAIYRAMVADRVFHNATDAAFLVCHHNDPYWIKQAPELCCEE